MIQTFCPEAQSLDDGIRDLALAVRRRTDRLKTAHHPSGFKKEFGKREVQQGIDALRKTLAEVEQWRKSSSQLPYQSIQKQNGK